MAEAFLGEIRIFGFNFAPRNWSTCDGQVLQISQNTALFSLLGCSFGGDCRTTFALPDLRGRLPMHQGTGPGLSPRKIAQCSGSEMVTLIEPQMPSHTHSSTATSTTALNAKGDMADTTDPNGCFLAKSVQNTYKSSGRTDVPMNSGAVTVDTNVQVNNAGSSQPHTNMPPFLVLNFCICLSGIYPSRN